MVGMRGGAAHPRLTLTLALTAPAIGQRLVVADVVASRVEELGSAPLAEAAPLAAWRRLEAIGVDRRRLEAIGGD